MREIMDALNDPAVERVVVIKASQVAYTETINNVLGYYISQDPAPVLIIQPTLELAEAWSKDRLAPMLRDTPALDGLVHDPKSRDSSNTIRAKVFPGGRLTIIGANAPAGLSARPIRIVLADEVDRWPISAGTEGDPLTLANKRQITFWNRKTLIGSTPVLAITSVIAREYEGSDRRRYYVPCPHCKEQQTLRWQQVRWDKTVSATGAKTHHPDTAHYVCEHCGAIWGDVERHDAIKQGEWRAENPGGNTAGFHVPGFLSPWLSLADIVREFIKARKDPALLQVWVNTVLGEPFEEAAEKVEGSGLIARAENYTPRSVPAGVVFVTAGVDTQADRLELSVIGWGANEESWLLAHEILHGDPAQASVWEELEHMLLTPMRRDDGLELRIRAACIDTGGHHANQVHAFCRPRRNRHIYPTKGFAGPRPIWPRRASRTQDKRNEVFLIGVDTAKDAIYGRLRISKPGPGYIHFPVGQGFDEEFFRQLTSEQVVTRKREGRPYRVWVLPPSRRNEALDCAVLALTARMSIRVRIEPGAPQPMPMMPEAPVAEPVDLPEITPPPTPAVRQAAAHSWLAQRGRGWWDRRR
jgi:phage terminase large subunit GpA-like protein